MLPLPCSGVQCAAWPSLYFPKSVLSVTEVGRTVACVPSPLLEQDPRSCCVLSWERWGFFGFFSCKADAFRVHISLSVGRSKELFGWLVIQVCIVDAYYIYGVSSFSCFFLRNLNFLSPLHYKIILQNYTTKLYICPELSKSFLIPKINLSCNATAHSIPIISNAYLKEMLLNVAWNAELFKHPWESKESIFTAL